MEDALPRFSSQEGQFVSATGQISQTKSASDALRAREALLQHFRNRPMGDEELLVNFGLFMRSGPLARLLFLNEIYQLIVPIPGIICEFGVWWGQSLAFFENFRAVYEPYNHTRRIVGFDTFVGYPEVGSADKRSEIITEGNYGVPTGYVDFLDGVLNCHEQQNVMSHIKKHELVVGDVLETAPRYFSAHPESFVALAFFDMALYEPTKLCLQTIRDRLVPGSVVAFDELNHADYPGETRAALEVLSLKDFTVHRSKFLSDRTYFVLR
jgi:hypothetical protein